MITIGRDKNTGQRWRDDLRTAPRSVDVGSGINGIYLAKITLVTGTTNATYSAEAYGIPEINITGATPVDRDPDKDFQARTVDTDCTLRRKYVEGAVVITLELVEWPGNVNCNLTP